LFKLRPRVHAGPRWHVHAFVNPADRAEFILEAGRSFGRWTVGAALVGIDGKAVPMVGGGVRW
jgi:hypothetical protein